MRDDEREPGRGAPTSAAGWLLAVLCAAALGGLLGALAGSVRTALGTIENGYLGQGLGHLASRILGDRALAWAAAGAAFSGSIALGAAALAPITRWLAGDERRGTLWAASAGLVAAAALPVAYWLNKLHLPGILEPKSLLANLGVFCVAAVGWFGVAAIGERFGPRPLRAVSPRVVGSVALALAAVLAATQTPRLLIPPALSAGERPDVFLILIDTLRADRLGAYGYERPTTPHLDRFARESWVFTDAVSASSWTKPAIASLFTSLYPRQHGIGADGAAPESEGRMSLLEQRYVTLAELLANAGYATAAFGSNHHILDRFGFAQGFRRYEWGLDGPHERSAVEIVPRFLSWLEDAPQGLFVYLHFIDVHFPYRPPAPFAGRFARGVSPLDYNDSAFMQSVNEAEGPLQIDDVVVTHMSDTYDEEIATLDADLGALFDELRQRDRFDGALIAVTSDHGEEFLEHGRLTHGHNLYDVALRIPLLVKFPCPGPRCGGRRVERNASIVDLFPTIAAEIGLAPPDAIAGRSLLTPSSDDEFRIAESNLRVSLRAGDGKIIRTLRDGRSEVYALDTDPGEQRDVAALRPELAADLGGLLDRWIEGTDSRAAPDVPIDAETRERLEALGYVR